MSVETLLLSSHPVSPAVNRDGDEYISIRNLTKSFFGQTVLDSVSFSLRAGEIRALLGENGAGKSTLINILSGVHQPDGGTVILQGRSTSFNKPLDAWKTGITTIHQEFSLFPDLTVAETIFAGHLPVNRFGFVRWNAILNDARQVLELLGVPINPLRKIAELSIAEQQLVEIARALTSKPRLIIMDEPTAALSPTEVEKLKQAVRTIAESGVAVIYVSHRLEEIKALCETYSVLRDGQLVGQGEVKNISIDGLVRLMVGRDLATFDHSARDTTGHNILEVENLSSAATGFERVAVRNVSFTVKAGEIVGFAGLVGAGRTEIARLLFGADPIGTGTLRLQGKAYHPTSPRDAIVAGIGLVPEDRKQQALFMSLTVEENFAIIHSPLRTARHFIDRQRERLSFLDFKKKLNLRAVSLGADIATLSGGNQQKVVLARWMAQNPALLIVDEPTRGVDIAAKADVHRLLRDMAAKGVAIILISSDLPEVLAVSDRILTMRSGQLTGELLAHEANEENVMQLMTRPVVPV
ncbi:sugar ABC transporter ATP-binding protein [Yersinia aleksiciae]|uniref:Sugar transport ATP-binding protein n=1 Tax=Yersinia aleksiciae TaxID=263819 RepID=A0A0T9TQ33_YERAE|nr:sugar ABC transporter ATP-binding protein [Yersinia aleksiciae]MDA5499416.1 sugar ABC transporter ATP-binding protein [Yersinia aleksiciae]WQC71760.1 sugar ABC transporter ATP-binding protein [Yersinia aleksiciae]CFQ37000.1 sugar transport ATP-binding protein [Yersinia aleksiciae]CNK95477.1 sugar transport ATP-binding protein [Yersinia aleksiciae]